MPEDPITPHALGQLKSRLYRYQELSRDNKEEVSRLCVKSMPRMITALLEKTNEFKDHTRAVRDFLREMYATMIDPVEDGPTTVAELCKALLEAARRQRESDNAMRTALASFVEFLEAYERRWSDAPSLSNEYPIYEIGGSAPYSLTLGHLRAAREALKSGGESSHGTD